MAESGLPVAVTSEPLYEGTISPLIYGDFVEFLNDLIPGMWAEKLEDRCFEGVTQPVHVYPPGTVWTYPRWRAWSSLEPGERGPFGSAGAELGAMPEVAAYELDSHEPFVGTRSARVTVRAGDGRPSLAGIRQDGIAVQAGMRLHFEAWVRSDGDDPGAITVRLGREYGTFPRTYDQIALPAPATAWHRISGELRPEATDDAAVLSIGVRRPSAFWIDKVSLMSEDNVRGWRPDVVRAIKELRPGVIRFGGSSLITYDWETGILPRHRRAPFLNQPWGNMESHDVGLYEFLEFCELVEAEPLVCTNSNSTTTASVLDEIEFCNGPSQSRYGRMRAELGHPEPFGVRYWQIGNEQSGEEYEQRLAADARAIRERHPELRLMASYPSRAIIAELSGLLDFVCPHFYEPYGPEVEARYLELIRTIRGMARNRDLRLGVTEWNITAGEWGWGRSWLLTQYCALNAGRVLQMYQRLGDMIRIANRSNMTNSCCSGIIQTSRTGMYVTPTYFAQRGFATLSGDVALRVAAGPGDPLSYSATRRESDGEVALFAVNMDSVARTRSIRVSRPAPAPRVARVWTLAAESLDAVNSFAEPRRVAPVETEVRVRVEALEHSFPPFSLSVLRWA